MTRYTKHFYRPRFDGKEQKRREHLGKLLRDAREEADFTQAVVACTLGYKRQHKISQIENGNRILDPIELENFAHLYGKPLNDFATWRDDQPTTEELQERARNAKPKPLSKKAKKRLANRRLYAGREPTMTPEEIAAMEKKRRRYFEAQALKESGEKSEP